MAQEPRFAVVSATLCTCMSPRPCDGCDVATSVSLL